MNSIAGIKNNSVQKTYQLLAATIDRYYQLETRETVGVAGDMDPLTSFVNTADGLTQEGFTLEQRAITIKEVINQRDYQRALGLVAQELAVVSEDVQKFADNLIYPELVKYQRELILLRAQIYVALFGDDDFNVSKDQALKELTDLVQLITEKTVKSVAEELFLDEASKVLGSKEQEQAAVDFDYLKYAGNYDELLTAYQDSYYQQINITGLDANNKVDLVLQSTVWDQLKDFDKLIRAAIDTGRIEEAATAINLLYFGMSEGDSNDELVKAAQDLSDRLPNGANFFTDKELSYAHLNLLGIYYKQLDMAIGDTGKIEDTIKTTYDHLVELADSQAVSISELEYYDEPLLLAMKLMMFNSALTEKVFGKELVKSIEDKYEQFKVSKVAGSRYKIVYEKITDALIAGNVKDAYKAAKELFIGNKGIDAVAAVVWYQKKDQYAEAAFLEWILLNNILIASSNNLDVFIESYEKYIEGIAPVTGSYAEVIIHSLRVRSIIYTLNEKGRNKKTMEQLLTTIGEIAQVEQSENLQPLLSDIVKPNSQWNADNLSIYSDSRKKAYAEYLYTVAEAYKVLSELNADSSDIKYLQEAKRLAEIVARIYPTHSGAIALADWDKPLFEIDQIRLGYQQSSLNSVTDGESTSIYSGKDTLDESSLSYKVGAELDTHFNIPMSWLDRVNLSLKGGGIFGSKSSLLNYTPNDSTITNGLTDQSIDSNDLNGFYLGGSTEASLFSRYNIAGPFYFDSLKVKLSGNYQTLESSYPINQYTVDSTDGYQSEAGDSKSWDFNASINPTAGLNFGAANITLSGVVGVGSSGQSSPAAYVDADDELQLSTASSSYLDLTAGVGLGITAGPFFAEVNYLMKNSTDSESNAIYDSQGVTPGVLQHDLAGNIGFGLSDFLGFGYFSLAVAGGIGVRYAGYPSSTETLNMTTSTISNYWNAGLNLNATDFLGSGIGLYGSVNYTAEQQRAETKVYSGENYKSRSVGNQSLDNFSFSMGIILHPDQWFKRGDKK